MDLGGKFFTWLNDPCQKLIHTEKYIHAFFLQKNTFCAKLIFYHAYSVLVSEKIVSVKNTQNKIFFIFHFAIPSFNE